MELLDLSNNENVEILDCSFNKIKNIKIYTPSIWLLDCEYNYLLDFSFLENIQNSDKIIYFQNQKPLPGGHFNENDINILKKIYQNNNVEELKWDFNSPEELMGITWVYKNGKYYIEQIDLSNRNIKGSIEGELIELKKLDVSDTKIKEIKLIALNLQELVCQNAELINLDLVTPNLKTIFCQYNSLSEETVNNILNLKNDYEIATVSKIDLYTETFFKENEKYGTVIEVAHNYSETEMQRMISNLTRGNLIDSQNRLNIKGNEERPWLWRFITWERKNKDGKKHVTEINVNGIPLSGTLYMDAFDYLNQLDIDNTKLEYLILPKNDFAYQWIQLYYAGSIKCETLKNVQIAGVAR